MATDKGVLAAPPEAAAQTRRPADTASGTVGVYALVALALLVPLSVADLGRLLELSTPALGASLVVLVSACRLSLLLAAGRPQLLSATFWIYVYVWLGLAPLAQITGDRFPIVSALPYDAGAQFGTVVVVLTGIFGFEIGRSLYPESARTPTWLHRAVDSGRARFLALVALPLAALIALSVGGIATLLSPREVASARLFGAPPSGANFHLIQDKTAGVLRVVLLTIPVFVALYLFLYLRRTAGLRKRAALVGLLVVANLLVNNPFSNSRLWFGTVALSLAAALFPLDSAARFRLAATGLLVVILVVFPYADAFRQTTRFQIRTQSLSDQFRTNPDYDSFEIIAVARRYVADEGHTLGRQLLGAALFWMPRSAWEGKPRDTNQIVAEHAAFSYTNVSCPLWAEAFVDGGLPGVFMVFVGYGWAVALLERRYLRRRNLLVGALLPVLAVYQLILLRGALLPAMARLVMLVGLIAFCTRAVRRGEDVA